MTILYASSLCSKKTEQSLLAENPESIGLQAQKYHRLLAKGFVKNGLEVMVLSFQNGIEKFGFTNRSSELENHVNYTYLTNRRGNYISLLWNSFFFAFKFLHNNKRSVVVCDVLNLTVSLGAVLAAKMLRRKRIGIITDFPEQLFCDEKIHRSLIWKLIGLCTGYVVLTNQMKDRLNSRKPAAVLEGHVDSDMANTENRLELKCVNKNCLYAGMIHKKYGIEKLVKAFCKADVGNSELHIFGDGDYRDELINLKSNRVKYHGVVSNDTVIAAEVNASLLINPRPSDEEFTKYSFPSKNLEYMSTGTPLLTTKLPGMPREYLDYLFFFEDESINGMKKTLEEILKKPAVELFEKGKKAKQFVLNNKTETIQAKKIIDTFSLF